VDERLREKLRDPVIAKDIRTVTGFTKIYCDGHHKSRSRTSLKSPGVEAGVYRRKVPVLCSECAELAEYAEKRRAYCPKDPKPFCSHCDTHCYKSEARERMREVMRYSGPRSMLHGYVVEGVRHLIADRHHKAEIRKAVASEAATKEEGDSV